MNWVFLFPALTPSLSPGDTGSRVLQCWGTQAPHTWTAEAMSSKAYASQQYSLNQSSMASGRFLVDYFNFSLCSRFVYIRLPCYTTPPTVMYLLSHMPTTPGIILTVFVFVFFLQLTQCYWISDNGIYSSWKENLYQKKENETELVLSKELVSWPWSCISARFLPI